MNISNLGIWQKNKHIYHAEVQIKPKNQGSLDCPMQDEAHMCNNGQKWSWIGSSVITQRADVNVIFVRWLVRRLLCVWPNQTLMAPELPQSHQPPRGILDEPQVQHACAVCEFHLKMTLRCVIERKAPSSRSELLAPPLTES